MKIVDQTIVDGSLFIGDTSTVIYKESTGKLIFSDVQTGSVSLDTISQIDVSLSDTSTYLNLNCRNIKTVYCNYWITSEISTNLNIVDATSNSTINVAIYKEVSANKTIVLDGSNLTFRGFNEASLAVAPNLLLDSSELINTFWEVSIMPTYFYDPSIVCFVAGPKKLT